MAVFFAVLGVLAGVCISGSIVVFAVSAGREVAYWRLAGRHIVIGYMLRLAAVFFMVACAIIFAYLGYLLA